MSADSEHTLPPFPVDPTTLDLLMLAIDPGGPDRMSNRSSVHELLIMLSQLGGSDTDAVVDDDTAPAELLAQVRELAGPDAEITIMRDPQYHEHDVIRALIAEIWRLRTPTSTPTPTPGHITVTIEMSSRTTALEDLVRALYLIVPYMADDVTVHVDSHPNSQPEQ